MEVYILDPLLRRIQVIDTWKSLIWTDRYRQYGDFELHVRSTYEMRNSLKEDIWLAMTDSHHVMIIETIQDETDSDGRRMMIVKGRSIETLLQRRAAITLPTSTTVADKWIITDPPADVARQVFHDICVTGTVDTADIIPYVTESTFMPADTIPEPIDPITVEIQPTTVYDTIANICDVWNLGFRLLRQNTTDTSQLWFDIYTGSDRTTAQTTLAPVIFSPQLENLKNTKELKTIEKAKNVAYVCSPAGFQMVFGIGVDEDVEGFERRVLVVDANDITEDNPDVEQALIQRGNEALAQHRAFQALEGEISQYSQYRPGVDYNLGDIVEMRNEDGQTNNMRVTEIIYVSDEEGERAYPTMEVNEFITTGSWLSWTSNKVWPDYGTTEYWADQP